MPTVVVPLLDASETAFSQSVGQPTTASGPEHEPTYVIKVVTMAGSLLTTLADAEVDVITWTLNAPDEAEFHFPKNAYTAAEVAVLGTTGGAQEIQIYRNGDLMFWGPIIRLEGGGGRGEITCHAAGTDWYLNRRFLDGEIPNRITNPDFESGAASWTAQGGVTFTADTTTFMTGTKCAKLVNTVAGADAYISQIHNVSANPIGRLLTVSAWFQIQSLTAAPYGDPWNRGIFIASSYGGVVIDSNGYAIDQATPRSDWVKGTATLWIPPNLAPQVEVRLYAPQGTIYWDDVKVVEMNSAGDTSRVGGTGPLQPIDVADIIFKMVQTVQLESIGKSHLFIGSDNDPTGTDMIKVWQYVDHVQFDQALREFVERDDGIDYHMRITPTSRVFHSYAGKRGHDLAGDVVLYYDVSDPTSRNCVDYRFNEDGGACITRQTVLGEDNGPAREQGEAFDATAIGGTILQDVRQAPHDTDVGSLQPLADERIARYSTVPQTIEMDIVGSSGLIPTINTGDLVTVAIEDGYVSVFTNMRIMKRSLNCHTNILTVTVTKDTL